MNERTAGIPPFTTRGWLQNGHTMTVYAWARRRQFPRLPAPEARYFQVAPDTQVRADCFWQPDRAAARSTTGTGRPASVDQSG